MKINWPEVFTNCISASIVAFIVTYFYMSMRESDTLKGRETFTVEEKFGEYKIIRVHWRDKVHTFVQSGTGLTLLEDE